MTQFNTNNGNNTGRTVINTNSVIMFSDTTMMGCKYGENLLTIYFRDAVIDENGKRKFPRPEDGDSKNSANLTKEAAALFLEGMDDIFIPQFTEYVNNLQSDSQFNKTTGFSIFVNKENTKILEINSGKPTNVGYKPAVRLHFDIGTDRIPRMSKVFTFSVAPILINYNYETGDYERVECAYPQILIFYKVIEEFIRSQTNSVAHELETRYYSEKKKVKETINQLAIKNGIEVGKASSNSFQFINGGGTEKISNPIKQMDGAISDIMGLDYSTVESNPY